MTPAAASPRPGAGRTASDATPTDRVGQNGLVAVDRALPGERGGATTCGGAQPAAFQRIGGQLGQRGPQGDRIAARPSAKVL